MTELQPRPLGRRIFNILAAVVLVIFGLFVAAISVGVAAIPQIRKAAERAAERPEAPTSTP